jgi:uncharacterized protein
MITMNRRKFLGRSTKQLALLNLIGLVTPGILADKLNHEDDKDKTKIQYRTLGKTGIRIPLVSMGVMNANNPNLVKGAWDSGIRHFDTAWVYQNGNNEKMIGSVLHEINVKREDVTIATKIALDEQDLSKGKDRKELFLKRFDESLGRLKMDYVDILYLHAADKPDQTNDPFIMEAFTELKANKKIRFSGFSTHSDWPELISDAANKRFYDVILLSFNFSMFQDQRVFDALKLAFEAGIGLVAMKTQCQQDWYKRDLPAEQQKFYKENQMNAALLKWVLRHEYITTAIPGFTTYDQMAEDIAVAYDLNFTKDEEDFFRDNNIKLAIQSVCRQCGSCISSCPQNADIPSLMRVRMYSLSYGNPLMARQTLSQIQQGKGLDICKDCGKCKGTCKYRVPIASHIHDLKEIYC